MQIVEGRLTEARNLSIKGKWHRERCLRKAAAGVAAAAVEVTIEKPRISILSSSLGDGAVSNVHMDNKNSRTLR